MSVPAIPRSAGITSIFANRAAAAAAIIFLTIVVLAAIAPLLAPYDPLAQDLLERLDPPSWTHWLGTDNYGRDVLSRVLCGMQISLAVGLGATVVAMVAGGAIGICAGYLGGSVDIVLSRAVDILLSFPSLILCLLIVALVGPGIGQLIVAIAVSLIPKFARVARSAARTVSAKEFIDACRTMGASGWRIMTVHIAPNIIGELIVMAALWTAHAVLIEASLSFLGLGVRPPTPTLGGMMLEGLNLLHDTPWLTLMPGITIFVAVFALNVAGDALRDAVDPRMREL